VKAKDSQQKARLMRAFLFIGRSIFAMVIDRILFAEQSCVAARNCVESAAL
jgi:hypothetical protein